ncbi:MAG TPA: cytochrome c [Acetobacteraceae bacterium]
MRTLIVVSLIAGGLAGPALAQDGDPREGRALAQTWCGGCHQVAAAPATSDAVPSFPVIARMPSTTAMSLRAFLSTPHARMPDFRLTDVQISDISAYILSLRPL